MGPYIMFTEKSYREGCILESVKSGEFNQSVAVPKAAHP